LNIVVLIKQVPDPEAPASAFKIENNRVVPPANVQPVISTYDMSALEAAMRLKESQGGKVTAITLGTGPKIRDALKQALAIGADSAIHLNDPGFEDPDAFTTATALAAAIRKLDEGYDLVLAGRQASDWDAGQVGPGVAELLGIPCVTIVRTITPVDGKLRVERVVEDGVDVLEVPLPALLTCTSEMLPPRYPTLKGIMAAGRKPIVEWGLRDLGLTENEAGPPARKSHLERLFVPEQGGECEFIEGETPAEAAEKLALRLREAKLI
jgi:electron transfer flavoprotein beta subunit